MESIKLLWKFIWKTLPTSEWSKLLAAPIALSIAGASITARFQEENRQNEIVNNYFEQIEKLVFVDKINLSQLSKDQRSIIKGKSLAVLRSIDIKRKEIIISFLSEFDLLDDRQEDGISLSYFNLSKRKFIRLFNTADINLSGLDLTGINLRRAILFRANFEGTILQESNLLRAELQKANLRFAKLQNANLSRARLQKADMWSAELQDSDLSRARLQKVELSRANLEGAVLQEARLKKGDLSRAELQKANLRFARLQEADLSSANLERANLRDARLQEANLSRANLEGAILQDARNLTHQQIKSACFWDQAIYKGEFNWNKETETWDAKNEKAIKDNLDYIKKLMENTSSNPEQQVDCSLWKNMVISPNTDDKG